MATVVTGTRLNISLCVHWLVSNVFKLNVGGEVMLNIYVKEMIIAVIIVIVLIDNTSQVLGIFIYYTAIHNIVSNFPRIPVSTDVQSNIRRMHCLQLSQKPCSSYSYVYRSEDEMAWVYTEAANLELLLTVYRMTV